MAAPCSWSNSSPRPSNLAEMPTINGESVDPALVEEAFQRLKAEAELASEASCCGRDAEFRARAEEEVTDGILLAQEAERRIPEPATGEVRAAFEHTLRSWRGHGASWDLLDAQREALRAETISRLRMEQFTQAIWNDLPEITTDDLRLWYSEHLSRFRTPAAARVLHLVRFPEDPDPWNDYATMLDLRRRALDGEDFNAIAAAHTQKQEGEVDLGWIEQKRLLNPFEAMLFSLQPGEISPVFHYERAYHLIKVTDTRPAGVTPFEDVAESLREEVTHDQRRRALKDLANRLRETAVIES